MIWIIVNLKMYKIEREWKDKSSVKIYLQVLEFNLPNMYICILHDTNREVGKIETWYKVAEIYVVCLFLCSA